MIRCILVIVASLLAVGLSGHPTRAGDPAPADDRVYRLLTTDQLEEILAGLNVKFKKSDNRTVRGIYYYDFKHDNFTIRLTSFDGKDLMLDNVFQKKLPLEKVNEWNRKAKFSRCSLHKDTMGDFLMLENNLDVLGGITRTTIRQYISQFQTECKNFDRFLATAVASANPNPKLDPRPKADPAPVANDKVYLPVTDKVLERALDGLNVEYEKAMAANGVTSYAFKMDGFAVRLMNFGGKDLMIDAVFPKTKLAVLNKYNIDRKFVRAVHYNMNGNEYTALEANRDCVAGISEGMVRHLITTFVQDAKHFANYLGNQS